MMDVESQNDKRTPKVGRGGHDPSLLLLIQALLQESRPFRITVNVGGLLISGRIIDENTWLELLQDLDTTLGDIVTKAMEASRSPPISNARFTYLQERLRWGSGLTNSQMEELDAAEQTEAQKSQFLHLAEVDIHGSGETIHLHSWRARLDCVDGYGLTTESERGHDT